MEPLRRYEERLELERGRRDEAARRSRLISHARLATFLAGAVAGYLGLRGPLSPAWLALLLLLAATFLVLVVLHDRVIRGLDLHERLCAVHEQGIARLAHDWDRMNRPEPPAGRAGDGVAADLDLFGRASLLHLLGTVRTPPGRSVLARWLLEPAPPGEIAARQEAVRELAEAHELRWRFEAEAMPLSGRAPDLGPLLEWAEGAPWLAGRPALVWCCRLLPVATALLAALQLAGVVQLHLWAIPVACSLLVARAHGRHVVETFDRVSARGEKLGPFVVLLRMLSGASFRSERLVRVRRELETDGQPAHAQMRRFARIVELADLRHSMFHLPLLALTLWDFHVLSLLERWQSRVGPRVRSWLDALGEAEALLALATLAHDEPETCFPTVTAEGPTELVAEGLGHPLIARGSRVVNDVTVGPAGTVLLVTGSNMSGKTTLLRSIGIAASLAQAGGPVCARRLSMPPVTLGTSVRVRDSLEQGVSFFMAEVLRIKQVLDLALPPNGSPPGTVLFLLDEVLQGTNSAERRVAVAGIVEALLARGAIGAISTHDLGLAELEGLEGACRPVHFTERLEGGEGGPVMTFDYRLRPGVARTTNALKLLAAVGIDVGARGR